MSGARIQVEDLTFRYLGRKQPALRHVSFEVPAGGATLLLGPSGCGKSTLSLCLNGGIPHFVEGELSGRVRVDGRDTRETSMAEMAQRVGVVFQDPETQFCMLTLEDEVAFGLENLGIPRLDMDARIDEALGWVGLAERRHGRIVDLSGGQKQRLALACVLALRPDVLVFDEPTAQLDPAAATEVVDLLTRLRQQGRHTLVIIEHRLDDLMPLVDQAVVFNRAGEMVAEGAPRRVLSDWAEWLAEAGVWVPQVCELATALGPRGIRLDPFPLTVDEAAYALAPHVRGLADLPRPASTLSAPTHATFASTRELTFGYPRSDHPALKDVTADLRAGEVTAIVGPNGAGKSTFARHFVRIVAPPPGHVFLEDVDIARLAPAQVARIVGYVFQYPEHQFIGRSVLDDVAFGLRRAGLPEVDAQRVALGLLEDFGLARLAEAHPYALSHGEQRRLSVAAMLALGQRGLFLDEPTFGQDRRNAYLLFDKLRVLAEGGHAVVAITHDMRLVAELASRVLVMEAGRTIFDGTPSALFSNLSVLADAHLQRPPVTQVADRLGLPPGAVLSIDALVTALATREVATR